jgi:hypothetical protein
MAGLQAEGRHLVRRGTGLRGHPSVERESLECATRVSAEEDGADDEGYRSNVSPHDQPVTLILQGS